MKYCYFGITTKTDGSLSGSSGLRRNRNWSVFKNAGIKTKLYKRISEES